MLIIRRIIFVCKIIVFAKINVYFCKMKMIDYEKKETRGRKKLYGEKTKVLQKRVPISKFEELKRMLEFELSK